MMFMMHISSLLALIVMLGSTALVVWSLQNKGGGVCLAKKVGYAGFLLSLLSLICIGYYGVKYWTQGEFESSAPMSMHRGMMGGMMPPMMHKGMMGGMMSPMMHKGMMGKMGNMMDTMDQTENTDENKDEHHFPNP